MSDDNQQLKLIIEGALLASGEPLSISRLQGLFDETEVPEPEALLQAIEEIKADCDGRGFELVEVASGFRFNVRERLAPWVNRLWEEKPQKYSRALLETLALVAYRQPITRGDIEEVRGVAVSSHIIKTLTERDWVKVVGHRDVPGRPALYATTKAFLDYFNLKSLEQLPSLGELKDIDNLNQNFEFVDDNPLAALHAAEMAPDPDDENARSDSGVPTEDSPGEIVSGQQAGDSEEQGPRPEGDDTEIKHVSLFNAHVNADSAWGADINDIPINETELSEETKDE